MSVNLELLYTSLSEKGYCLLPHTLSKAECNRLSELYDKSDLFRSTVNMERYRFGKGEYKYLNYPLPETIKTLRETLYKSLAPLANEWMKQLSIDRQFPEHHAQLLEQCHTHKQVRPTPLILRYEKEDLIRYIRIFTEKYIFLSRLLSLSANMGKIMKAGNLY